MTANTDAQERSDGESDARDPEQGRGRAFANPSGLHALHLSATDQEISGTVVPEEIARELLAAVSDRIRNPLQVILALADLMEDEETAGRIRKQVYRINDAVKYLEDVLSDSPHS